jgi:hypothetical protein
MEEHLPEARRKAKWTFARAATPLVIPSEAEESLAE